jgi:hypothetical protein
VQTLQAASATIITMTRMQPECVTSYCIMMSNVPAFAATGDFDSFNLKLITPRQH